jgi:hypothetical protein
MARHYRILTFSGGRAHFAQRNGCDFAGMPLVSWVQRKVLASKFSRKDAAAIARRMRRLRIKTRIEAA